jgi:hypothetical protein
MNLNGNKSNVNVTLQLKLNGCLLIVDNAHKVLTIEYNDSTTLHKVKQDINNLVDQLGYTPVRIIHKKVKNFKFN